MSKKIKTMDEPLNEIKQEGKMEQFESAHSALICHPDDMFSFWIDEWLAGCEKEDPAGLNKQKEK